MEAISIYLRNTQDVPHEGEVFQLGVPLVKACLPEGTQISLFDPNTSSAIPCQSDPMTYWPDGSVRWLKLRFLADLAPGQHRTLELRKCSTLTEPRSALSYKATTTGLEVDTGAGRFNLSPRQPAWTKTGSAEPLPHELSLISENGIPCRAITESDWVVVEQGNVSLRCELTGWFLQEEKQLAKFRCRLTFYHRSQLTEVETCLHNPRRARHPGGLWDLGDPGSIHFRSLVIQTRTPDITKVTMACEPGNPEVVQSNQNCLLYQDSSGGENWASTNHVDARGEITTRFRGYRLYSGDEVCQEGTRARPIMRVNTTGKTVQASMAQFWENFPSSLGVQHGKAIIGLFPADTITSFELQGGERKTQTTYLYYGDSPHALNWTQAPVIPILNAQQYQASMAFPWFQATVDKGPLEELIQLGLEGPSDFFKKREIIDEYGWRNFGDIFADHESLYQSDTETPLISHYNNQYDAIYGFARQFALSGDIRWYRLMNDLAAHVRDIDIYHTDEDRVEYNNGLFWHTDHYLPAHTSTHRTFSKHNDTSSTPGQTGGGPAEEHCYTTGLLYHYLLTGNIDSRRAVLELARWITGLHEGSGALTEALLKIKRYELPKLKLLLKGRKLNPYRYSFNRGTGNYVNALIDAHLLDPASGWLEQAESVIRATVHPKDDIQARDLLSVEQRWSYLVFLLSLSRYIVVKKEAEKPDSAYQYALCCFRHYSRWMLQHERPFLTDPEQLEYPNHTWVAQDIRKSMILFQAIHFDPKYRAEYLEKARQLLRYVTEELSNSKERSFSRVQIILLQNYGPHTVEPGPNQTEQEASEHYFQTAPSLSLRQIIGRSAQRLARAIRKFSVARERAWLKSRLDS